MKKLIFIVLASCIVFTGCRKDEPITTEDTTNNATTDEGTTDGGTTVATTVEEDKGNIKASLSAIVGCMQSFRSGEFVSVLNDFFSLSGGESMNEDWIQEIVEGLEPHLDIDYIEETNRFILSNHNGTYTYSPSSKTWSKSAAAGNSIILIFPSNASSSTSDMSLNVSGYSDQMVTIDGESIYIPTSGSIQLSKSGSEIAHFNLIKASYDLVGDFALPTLIDASIKVAPFTYKLDYQRSSPTQFTCNLDVSSTVSCGYSVNAKLNLTHSDYNNIDGENDIDNVEINFEYPGALGIKSTIDVDGISALGDNATTSEVNSKIDAIVSYNSIEIGELELADFGGDQEVIIRYKDNTTENVNIYTDVFLSDFENVFYDMTGEWD